jgi:hypothetical protein
MAVPLLLGALVLGSVALPRLLFIAPMLQAQAGGGRQAGGGAFQGFTYLWTARMSGGGYTSPDSAKNLKNEATTFHMNSVIIPVYADMAERSASALAWHPGDSGDQDTLAESEYVQAIKDARAAGLTPILELEVRQQDSLSNHDESAYWVGKAWFDQGSSDSFNLSATSGSVAVGAEERAWMDNYTGFAVHYAQLSAQYHLPYFIMGDELGSISYDTANSVKSADPTGVAGGPSGCTGRRDCEWRHIIQAIRGQTYTPLTSSGNKSGGSYTGKLIYSADWNVTPDEASSQPEFEKITWWDALDYIGVDAHFPLTRDADVSSDTLSNAWHGKGPDVAGQGDVYSRIGKVADTFSRSVVFTSAGYESVAGSNSSPGQIDLSTAGNPDNSEQESDMAALLQTFGDAPWWVGVFWYADQPMAYGNQANWIYSSNWANLTLKASKPAGQYLASFYQNIPTPAGG